ncbi:MAG: class I SAM-dependent RNA methyltransferase [Hyphomicrobiales bacterium]|nr:class I SAM-dependent RNA methyltransferase [Hyphomicrobiales bacterium]
MRRELVIDRLGGHGDGIAKADGQSVYVPFALPGETVLADVEGERGALIEILQTTAQRQAPICRHFGQCGGCSVQHLAMQPYLDWKRDRIIEGLSLEGISVEPEPTLFFGPHTRRRAVFTAEKAGRDVRLGFRRAASHELIAIEECPVLLPSLEASLPVIVEALRDIMPDGEARIQATMCDNGLDLNIDSPGKRLGPISPRLGHLAEQHRIIRITDRDEPMLTIATPRVTLDGVELDLPPQAFLQAGSDAEAAMARIAVKAAGKAKTIADLFSGLGAFTFALARKARVTAIEVDKGLLAALDVAARRAKGRKPVTTLARNLALEPLSFMELNAYDAVLFDPPRGGALPQARTLAKSRVPAVIAVSCNPVTFAKDARALCDGGYRLNKLTPIDQFVYSAHVELVAVFNKR